ncbi:MAG: hypothetical protein A4E52_00374 [Pelotomaculum sp. PtaB.Bin013]|uniref:Copper amine oxidase N-terminal domain-containing protein n=1 Tax=Pelotomaculum isophthalicicum JI TaxID=947010 RepID=A0A9X4JTW2_9FIRM|nr:copper amine oxidase N-terminal domain-containing protein [Pelotomaculum isophthalicicum]MDF9409399.1 copper amine oxidase N-terminal domain-containing protein [Pelotomaculum isophthalicicum JI]OPX91759.1 MAG: hypothetical protein A4E52_00374 [Pelotomaculum sp. PtaB.Bin013]
MFNTKLWVLFLAVFCIFFTAGMHPARASVLSVELGEPHEYSVGGDYNNFWDLKKNITGAETTSECFAIYGNLHPRLVYKGGQGGGFVDAGSLDKPAGDQTLQVSPEITVYQDTQDISEGHLYILKTLTLGYFALYADSAQVVKDVPYLNFTFYKLKGAPSFVASAPVAPAAPSVPAMPVTPPQTPEVTSSPAAPRPWPGGNTEPAAQLTEITFNQKPMVVNDRTFVPLRDLFEALRADVKWDSATRTVLATKGQNKISLQIDNKVAWVNEQPRQLEAAPFINNEKTYVPLRFASEALGEKVSYDSATGKVVFGNRYFYLGQENSAKTTEQVDNTAGQETVTESNSSEGEDLRGEINKYWNNRLRYDALQKSLFGR